MDIYKSSYTGPLLCLDTGLVSAGAGVMPQAIGKPLLRLGKLGYSQTTGDYYGIGFGYAPLITDFNCAEIGTLITSTAGNETGDLVFSTRPNGTNVAATERLRITSTGNVIIGGNVNVGSSTNPMLHVYGSDPNNIIGCFKHPNNSQGIGIGWDGIFGLGNGSGTVGTGNQSIRLVPLGTGVVNVQGNLTATGVVIIQTVSTGIPTSDMKAGSLKIGNTNQNYGSISNGSTDNMGCIVLECMNDSDIALHDAGNANISLIRYTSPNKITIGRDVGWGNCLVFKGNNGTAWDQTSDHRIKENVKKANLTICYDNVKNINLYRFNYTKAFGNDTHKDRTQLGFIAQQVNLYYPKSITRGKRRLDDNKEVPDLASIDITQVNFTLFGAMKQLIRVVEKQSNRIKRLEEMLNIVADDEVENDADEPYVKIVCEGEVDIDSIVPSEPEENISSSNTSNVF